MQRWQAPGVRDINVGDRELSIRSVGRMPTAFAALEGKDEGQPADTGEVEPGCWFTPTTTGKEGSPVRDPDSTSYVAAIETAQQFGDRLHTDAWRRGWSENSCSHLK